MFVIGETKGKVYNSKLELPKEYKLKKKDKKIYGVWSSDSMLCLSDEIKPLKAKAARGEKVFEPMIDSSSKITIPSRLNQSEAVIRGLISTIEIEFI